MSLGLDTPYETNIMDQPSTEDVTNECTSEYIVTIYPYIILSWKKKFHEGKEHVRPG